MLRFLLFDVDDTLYPRSSPVWPTLRGRILQYVVERLGLSMPEAEALRERYLREFGTTTRGLYLNDHIDIHEYLAYVHDLPLSDWLLADPELRRVLEQIPLTKCLFTNASRQHGVNVVKVLGITDQFTHNFALEDFDFISKPDPHPYRVVLERLQATAQECMFIEDSLRNLATAKQLGMATVLIDGSTQPPPGADYTISRVHDLLNVMRDAGVQLKADDPLSSESVTRPLHD
jgi:putative hydrolase of the HAD superfamily